MISVPQESTYHPETAVTARPAPPPNGETPAVPAPANYARAASPGVARQHTAKAWGKLLPVSTVLILVLFASAVVRAFVLFAISGLAQAQTSPSTEEIRKMQLQIGTDPWLAGSMMGPCLRRGYARPGIVSLAQFRRGELAWCGRRHHRRAIRLVPSAVRTSVGWLMGPRRAPPADDSPT